MSSVSSVVLIISLIYLSDLKHFYEGSSRMYIYKNVSHYTDIVDNTDQFVDDTLLQIILQIFEEKNYSDTKEILIHKKTLK